MKQFKLSKYMLSVVVLALVATIGVAVSSHSSAATNPSFAILGPSNAVAAPGISVGGLTSGNINYVAEPQVIYVGPGAKLKFNQGVKGNVKHCYFVQAIPDKGGNGSAKVNFASNNRALTKTVAYNSSNPGALQQVCVSPGTAANPGYNVYNTSKTQGIIVYQDVLSY